MQRRTLIIAAAAALAAPAVAATRGQMWGPPRMRGVPGVSRMRLWGVMPAVSVIIHGKGPFTLGIDTGADAHLSLTAAVAKAAGLTRVGTTIAADPSGKNPVTVARYRVGNLSIGGATFEGLDAEETPTLGNPGAALDGVIGVTLFDALTLTLDFSGRQVILSRTGLPPPDRKTVFGYEAGPLIQLPLKIGEVVAPTHLDTGQSIAPLIVPQELVANLPTHGAPTKVGTAHTVTESMDIFRVALDAPVRLGDVRFPVTDVIFPTVVPIANLGSAALQAMSVTIDRPARRIRFVG